MITKTSLQHPTTRLRIHAALRQAVRSPGCPVLLYNSYGRPFMGVHYLTGELAWQVLGRSGGFYAWSYPRLLDYTDTLIEAIREKSLI